MLSMKTETKCEVNRLESNINQARLYWESNNLDKYNYILLLPDLNTELNDRIKSAFEQKLCGRLGFHLDGETARNLIKLYSYYEFSDKIIIGSFDEPYGRKLRNLTDSKIATEDELICDVILGGM